MSPGEIEQVLVLQKWSNDSNIFAVLNLGIPLTHCTFWEVENLQNCLFFHNGSGFSGLLVQGLLYGYLRWCFSPCLAPKSEFPFESFRLVPVVLGMGITKTALYLQHFIK